MKKIKGLDVYFKNKDALDQDVATEIKRNVLKIFDDLSPDKYNKTGLWSAIAMAISLIATIVMVAVGVAISNYVMSGMGGLFAVLFVVAIVFWARNKSAWTKEVSKRISVNALCKLYFQSRYDNVKIQDGVNIDNAMIRSYRGTGVPGDATILNYFPGLVFNVDGIEIHTAMVLWHWYRTVSDGKRTYTKEYRKSKFISYVPQVASRWEGFKLSLTMGAMINKGRELENDKFNKMFSYVHSDPIKLRVMFTPLIQEIMVEHFGKTSAAHTFAMDIVHNKLIATKDSVGGNAFVLDRVPLGKKDKVAEKIEAELRGDFQYLEEQLSIIATLREFIINR